MVSRVHHLSLKTNSFSLTTRDLIQSLEESELTSDFGEEGEFVDDTCLGDFEEFFGNCDE